MTTPIHPAAGFESLPVTTAFLGRTPDVNVATDRTTALANLAPYHTIALARCGLDSIPLVTAEQVHGDTVTVVHSPTLPFFHLGCDALITNLSDICLGIYVADCAAVWLYDPVRRVIGLVHSGKKGTELGIVPKAIASMNREYGCLASDIVASISPCIRPPHYEVDFAATIRAQLADSGVSQIHDKKICTFANPAEYYSYRRERGLTGRMLALLAQNSDSNIAAAK